MCSFKLFYDRLMNILKIIIRYQSKQNEERNRLKYEKVTYNKEIRKKNEKRKIQTKCKNTTENIKS